MKRYVKIDPSELVAISDIATLCGVGQSAVSNWQKRHADFPQPVATVANGDTRLYLRPQVMRWWQTKYPNALADALTRAQAVAAQLEAIQKETT